ncbi:hypothetical protein BC834DRAFT_816339 [Gloeopeniophorella convolvens]|nr:hypothetical protein BC834DRAFT_816339 [Gloeopeniophorella convolvens]
MLVPRRPPLPALRALRALHSTARVRDRVAPPDPVSNIRPILYDDPLPTTAELMRHPYSLSEFVDNSDMLEYQWKLQRQELDAFNDAFWRDTNTRFEAGKAAAMGSLHPEATPAQREVRLSEFYRDWVLQEGPRQQEYNAEYRRMTMEQIKLAARVSFRKLRTRFMGT